jgi:hypothetical protein
MGLVLNLGFSFGIRMICSMPQTREPPHERPNAGFLVFETYTDRHTVIGTSLLMYHRTHART